MKLNYLTAALLTAGCMTLAGAQHDRAAAQDRIEVVAHVALPGAAISRIGTSSHWQRNFIELNDDAHKTVTLVDVTDLAHPDIVRRLSVAGFTDPSVEAMVGDTALVADGAAIGTAVPKSLSIVNFSDPAHPVTEQKFDNVTAMTKAPGGIVYVTDVNGLWILRQQSAPDKALDAQYKNYVLYGLR